MASTTDDLKVIFPGSSYSKIPNNNNLIQLSSSPSPYASKKYLSSFTVTYPTAQLATIAHDTVTVDKDIREGRFERFFDLNENNLTITFKGNDAKAMRVAVGGIIEMLSLSTKTMALYGGSK